ncbi:glycerophosphodiester phosphodiesterase [Streptococcus caviae]|uniref:glycerophosphodiester phosphodiesterase n=1 Tax=Streptococcus sp. 'caviae' TaxID=1915004 RepID=UPI00094BAB87|nr:glycerophosphodiester phosphodiesterase [Streptococcus sp. 'caviae']OLN83661.1 glycerophosphodiester phosphodiesterase [Streptococcus sp. 'caviae']
MTQIFAHRGSKSNRPENTLAAFAEAARVGSDGIELDVHRTKDNHLVVIHDESVNRTTNGRGLVRHLTLQQLKSLDAGSWFHPSYFREKVPTLEEVLQFLEEQHFTGILNIELKTNRYPYPKIEKQIAQLMHAKKRPFSHMYSSFNFLSLLLMKKHDPKAERAYLVKLKPLYYWLGRHLNFIETVHCHRSFFLNKPQKGKQKPLRIWTINKSSDMKKAYLANIKGIITDKPEEAGRIRKSLSKAKMKQNKN